MIAETKSILIGDGRKPKITNAAAARRAMRRKGTSSITVAWECQPGYELIWDGSGAGTAAEAAQLPNGTHYILMMNTDTINASDLTSLEAQLVNYLG